MKISQKVNGKIFDTQTNEFIEGIKTIQIECKEIDKNTKGSFPFELFQLYNFKENKFTNETELNAKPDVLHRLTILYVNEFCTFEVPTDKTELLNDSFALLSFGNKLFNEIFTPFFLNAMPYFV